MFCIIIAIIAFVIILSTTINSLVFACKCEIIIWQSSSVGSSGWPLTSCHVGSSPTSAFMSLVGIDPYPCLLAYSAVRLLAYLGRLSIGELRWL